VKHSKSDIFLRIKKKRLPSDIKNQNNKFFFNKSLFSLVFKIKSAAPIYEGRIEFLLLKIFCSRIFGAEKVCLKSLES